MGHHDRPRRRVIPESRRALVAAAAVAAIAIAGCGDEEVSESVQRPLLIVGAETQSPVRAQLRAGARLARRFARSYARDAYHLANLAAAPADPEVSAAIEAAAERVPLDRRRLQPRLRSMRIAPSSRRGLRATAWISDGHFPPFSIAFTLRRGPRGWEITSISLPG